MNFYLRGFVMSKSSTHELDIYRKLADLLDKIPNGFTKTEDDTHIKLLQWIYTPEEAELTCKMKLRGETVEELALRLNLPKNVLEEKLKIMHSKGQIYASKRSSGKRYGLMPYVVGVYEEQLERMDKEFATLTEEWFDKSKYADLFGTEPAIFKVIPINRVIKPELEIYPYEQAEEIINRAKSWGVRECICKKQQDLLGNKCQYPAKICLNFSSRENTFENHRLTTAITKEQALEYLRKAEESGLVHCSMNIQTGHEYICNCCTCCCGVLRALTKREQPHAFVKSNFIIAVDEDLCGSCATCLDRCQFDALTLNEDDICEVDINRCVGCGVCAIKCPEDALALIERVEKTEPLVTFKDWMTQKAKSRQVNPSDLL
jgi:Pyruvate/2-oxoacid:ferredoxin oxidoreductase delta subunit